jgi:hypothetical protein
MVLGSTQPLTEMSIKNLTGAEERPELKADNLTAICEPIVYKMWEPRRLTNLWASTACYGDSVTVFPLRLHHATGYCRARIEALGSGYRLSVTMMVTSFWDVMPSILVE